VRRAAKVDLNHGEVVKALQAIGASVQSLAAVGKGCPDILVGLAGRNWIIEIKDGSKCPSERKLNDKQVEWHRLWRGQVHTVTSSLEAVELVTNK